MVYIEEFLFVMTDLPKIDRIGARNVPRLQEHKRLDDDATGWQQYNQFNDNDIIHR